MKWYEYLEDGVMNGMKRSTWTGWYRYGLIEGRESASTNRMDDEWYEE